MAQATTNPADLQIVQLPIDGLHPDPANPRKISSRPRADSGPGASAMRTLPCSSLRTSDATPVARKAFDDVGCFT